MACPNHEHALDDDQHALLTVLAVQMDHMNACERIDVLRAVASETVDQFLAMAATVLSADAAAKLRVHLEAL